MGSTIATTDLAMIDVTDPAGRPDDPEVRAARAAHWCARTPIGLAVLRYDKLTSLLGDRRLAQGSHRILTAQGLTEGPLVEWMNTMILSTEGDDHQRVRRLVSRASTPRAVTALRPRMREIVDELVDAFPAPGTTVEFMTAFADPGAATRPDRGGRRGPVAAGVRHRRAGCATNPLPGWGHPESMTRAGQDRRGSDVTAPVRPPSSSSAGP